MRAIHAGTAFAFAVLAAASTAAPAAGDAILLRSLFRFRIATQVAAQAGELGTKAGAAAAAQVTAAAEAWGRDANETIREDLEAELGAGARGVFSDFVAAFSSAERTADAAYLAALSGRLGWPHPPADYDALRGQVVQVALRDEVAEAGRFLGEVQTWLDVRARTPGTPPLREWLDRGETAAPPSAAAPAPPARPVDPLRQAEAPAGEFRAPELEAGSSLDAFGATRNERRTKAVEEAQAGMQLVADERRAAEDERAARKLSAAQAEVEAVKKHAEKLAAAETEALEQRKNSWSGRIKQVLTATISAAGGAFLGNVGSRAGEAAAEAVFKK